MGWGAADAFYQSNRAWLDSVEDAYDVLYGGGGMSNSSKRRCPICGNRSRDAKAVVRHMRLTHKADKFGARIADFIAQAGVEED